MSLISMTDHRTKSTRLVRKILVTTISISTIAFFNIVTAVDMVCHHLT